MRCVLLAEPAQPAILRDDLIRQLVKSVNLSASRGSGHTTYWVCGTNSSTQAPKGARQLKRLIGFVTCGAHSARRVRTASSPLVPSPSGSRTAPRICSGVRVSPLSSECGTCKAVTARFRSWRSGNSHSSCFWTAFQDLTALLNETDVETGTSQRKSGTSVNFR